MIYDYSEIYEGTWKKKLKDGQGKMIYSNGDCYEGNWIENKI